MKRKGFTLIELLAVIVILAIIALIATPMIMNVIEKARRGAALGSANSYLHSVEMYLTLQDMNEYSEKLESNKVYSIYETTELYEGTEEIDSTILLSDYIDVKGDYPIDGYVEIGANKIKEAIFNINGYRIECDNQLICKVTNKISTEIVEAESVTIKEVDTSGLTIGDTIQLEATILPIDTTRKKVTWSSSDESVATVSKTGLLTVVGNGSTTVTASTSNHKISSIEIEIPLSMIQKDQVKYATLVNTVGTNNIVWNEITIVDGVMTIQNTAPNTASGWGESLVYLENLTIDTTKYKKLIVDAEWKRGYKGSMWITHADGSRTDIFPGGPDSGDNTPNISRTTVEVDLTGKSQISEIGIRNNSMSAQWIIYDIHFE